MGDHDPTAHAEINAIRKACNSLKNHDLTGCTLYATGYPCPMCLSAIIWANISTVYFGCDVKEANNIGFRDDKIYDFIKSQNSSDVLKLIQLSHKECIKLYEEYINLNKKLY